jgi:hypothetical protein
MEKPGYQRFKIETKPAPHAFAIPPKFDVSARKVRLAAMLVHEAFEYRFKKEVVLSRPCIYGVFGGRLGGFKPIKQKCVGCMRCVQEYPHIMTVKLSDDYKKLGDSFWTPENVFTVWNEASTGKIPIRGMGYKGGFGGEGFDGMWTDMSEIVRPTRDGVYGREYISTVVDVGRKPFSIEFNHSNSIQKTVQVPIPIIFDSMPGKIEDENVSRAIEIAASHLNTFYISKAQEIGKEVSSCLVPLIKRTDTEDSRKAINNARIVEYEKSGSKLLRKIKEENPNVVVAARLPLDDVTVERASGLIEKGIDGLHLYADYHGMDYSSKPRHISEALKDVHSKLVEEGIRDQVTIIASGGVILAEHVPKTIICGADLVALDTTLLVALQAEFEGESKNRGDCQMATRKIDPEWGAQRIVNLMASWHDQLIEILSAMGMRDVRRLRGDVGRSMLDAELREQSFKGIGWAA